MKEKKLTKQEMKLREDAERDEFLWQSIQAKDLSNVD